MQLNAMRLMLPTILLPFYFAIKRKSPLIGRENVWTMLLYCIVSNALTISLYVPVVYIPLASWASLYHTSHGINLFIIFGLLLGNKSEWIQVCMCGSHRGSFSTHGNPVQLTDISEIKICAFELKIIITK